MKKFSRREALTMLKNLFQAQATVYIVGSVVFSQYGGSLVAGAKCGTKPYPCNVPKCCGDYWQCIKNAAC